MGSNSGWDVDWNRPPTTDEDTDGTTTPPPVSNEPQWYTPTNIYLPPGVDPYYGVSITGINGSSGGGSSGGSGGGMPKDQDFLGGSKAATDADRQEYQDYLNNYGYGAFGGDPSNAMSYSEWRYWKDNIGSSNNNTGGTNTGSGGFKIARPNMTWNNNLPTVAPANGQDALNAYAPLPFTREANTPGVNYVKPQLTYNNPYNTNPYLPTANPFALIANTPASGS